MNRVFLPLNHLCMEDFKSYCSHVATLPAEDLNILYHDKAYGFPITDDAELFGRLILEINQAGLSWNTILKKASAFKTAFHDYDIARIALYSDFDRKRLLEDADIVRNRMKIDAVIMNAGTVMTLQKTFGSFKAWLDHNHPQPLETWIRLFKINFKFTGAEIVNEFLMSVGYLEGAHKPDCPIYKTILELKPAWSLKKV